MNKKILAIMISVLIMTSCSNPAVTGEEKSAAPQVMGQENSPKENDPKENIDLDLKPNEAGKIMVLMYHNIGKEEKEWVRTPANFLKDLTVLYEKGYRPISLQDYVTGRITTEQGFTPVVITFDDGNLNNFEYLENGFISKECAVGLLLDFHEKHQDFPLEAIFFITGGQPFKQRGLENKKLSFIIDKGMDIGNHTSNHPSFKNATGEEIQEEIGAQAQLLQGIINRDDYEINTLALPFGERPGDKTLTNYLAFGSYQDIPYKNIAVLNVGWNPGYSPYDSRFDYLNIPRIRASEMKVDNVGLYDYLAYFDKHPEERFISDGVEGVITIPANKLELLGTFREKEIYTYDTK